MNKKIKTLIIYETGIHYIIIINEKKVASLGRKLHTISIYKSRNCNLKLKSSFTKVKRIIPQKNHSTSIRSPVQTQETVYELSRSRKNGVSFKEKAKRTTTKNKTNRKKQKKSNSWLRGYRKIV